jgi:hypothetical protein
MIQPEQHSDCEYPRDDLPKAQSDLTKDSSRPGYQELMGLWSVQLVESPLESVRNGN